jgi:hypothetical protein
MFAANRARNNQGIPGSVLDQEKQNISLPTCLDVKYPLEHEAPELTPRDFCRKMFGIDDMPEVEILRMEIKKSYQKKCIGLLSQVLRVSRQSVLNWNSDELEFSKMPSYHRQTLGLFYEYRKLLTEVKRLRRFTC